MLSLLRAVLAFITFKKWRYKRWAKMRRERYEELKALIAERHFGGYAGLIVENSKFDKVDMCCFPSPMYHIVKNKDMKWCIFWDRSRMVREIGTGAPLKDGEVLIPDTKIRTKPDGTLDTINEQKALTHQEEASDGEDDL